MPTAIALTKLGADAPVSTDWVTTPGYWQSLGACSLLRSPTNPLAPVRPRALTGYERPTARKSALVVDLP